MSEVDLIKERLNIADLVGEYVQLKKAGTHFKGLCPFHQEKTPSFVVSPEKGIWHCFGCGKGGDAFSFLKEKEGMEFREALELLASRTGVTITTKHSPTAIDARSRLFELMNLAKEFYRRVLEHEAGRKARTYLSERGLTEPTIAEFEIGYAPHQWDGIQQALRKKGFSNQELLASGLVGRSQRGTLYDRFRGRIMFPIADAQGRTIAFGGRIVPWHTTGNEGKYINSPETDIYEKRRTVYNLHQAKAALGSESPAIVVEGYLDVVMLAQAQVLTAVAVSGTAFTAEHAALLKRYTPEIHVAFDADQAGFKAAQSATAEAVSQGLLVSVIELPEGQDPADVASDSAQLKQLLAEPKPLIEVLMNRLVSSSDTNDRQELLQQLLPVIKRVADPVQQGEMIARVAQRLHVPEPTLLAQLSRTPVENHRKNPSLPERPTGRATGQTPEELLLGLYVHFPETQAKITPVMGELSATSKVERAGLWQKLTTGEPQNAEENAYIEALRTYLEDIIAEGGSPETLAAELLQRVEKKGLKKQIYQIQQNIVGGTASHDDWQRLQDLARQLHQR